MSKKSLRFLTLGVTAFAGITKKKGVNIVYPEGFDVSDELKKANPEDGLVIVFPEGFHYVQLEGNQEVGKTSLIKCIQEAAGGLADANSVNKELNDKKYGERFWGMDGNLYSLRVTKTTITLERIDTDPDTGKPVLNAKGKEVSSIIKEPKSMLQKLIGPAGISPMALRDMKPADQVKWIRGLMTLSVDIETEEVKLKKDIDETYKARTVANKEFARLKALLDNDQFYKEQEKWIAYFDKTDYEALQTEVKTAQDNYRVYTSGVELIPRLNEQKKVIDDAVLDLEEQMRQLQIRLDAKKQEAEAVQLRIETGEQWLKDNEKFKTEYEALSEKIEEASQFPLRKQNYDNMREMEKAYNHNTSESVRLTTRYDQLMITKKEFVKQFTPEIPNLEICVPDESDAREGLFYKGKTLELLAESELWEVATQLWASLGVKMVFVENISSLGTGSIAKFNEFLQKGGYIFATVMNRAEDNLKISFHDKIS